MSLRSARRRLAFGLSTLLGLAPRGFFIPYRYAAGVASPERYPALEPIFTAAAPAMRTLLATAARYKTALAAIGHDPAPLPRWRQDWFPRLDAALAYVLTREQRFGRIVEIGSGHSTRFLARAVRDGDLATRVTAIDPKPRAALNALAVERVPSTVQEAGLAPFAGLTASDAVVIDSSHILMPGTDVDFLVSSVLPALPSGIHVHIHDIFLPTGYPADWLWRGYNEQSVVAGLIAAGVLRVVWSSAYAVASLAPEIAAAGLADLPLVDGARESSLWAVKA
jgi:hypothetical protein